MYKYSCIFPISKLAWSKQLVYIKFRLQSLGDQRGIEADVWHPVSATSSNPLHVLQTPSPVLALPVDGLQGIVWYSITALPEPTDRIYFAWVPLGVNTWTNVFGMRTGRKCKCGSSSIPVTTTFKEITHWAVSCVSRRKGTLTFSPYFLPRHFSRR